MTPAHPPDATGSHAASNSPPESDAAAQKSADASIHVIALLGRSDFPTDGVRDYCEHLSQAFARRGSRMDVIDFRWENNGWLKTLRRLWKQSRAWKNRIVLLQYTALMWSRRGFPSGALAVLAILKWRGVRLGVVFHDASYPPARGWIRRLRIAWQIFTSRAAFRQAECPVLTIPASQLSWLPADSRRAVFIPVGANFPANGPINERASLPAVPTVAVFGVTGGDYIEPEIRDIAFAMKRAATKVAGLRLMVFGRNALEAESALRRELSGTNIAISVSGVLPADEVRARLAQAEVLLFVRGPISSRRGSAIAGIVCGLAVVGYRGAETAAPITEAGVLLVADKDREALAEALTRLLTDDHLYRDLRESSLAVAEKYFSWDAIAAQFARALTN